MKKELKPELQDMYNFLSSIRSNEITQNQFPFIQQFYREKIHLNFRKLKENPKQLLYNN
jgi:poly-D-alanine transfer protein DltD